MFENFVYFTRKITLNVIYVFCAELSVARTLNFNLKKQAEHMETKCTKWKYCEYLYLFEFTIQVKWVQEWPVIKSVDFTGRVYGRSFMCVCEIVSVMKTQ